MRLPDHGTMTAARGTYPSAVPREIRTVSALLRHAAERYPDARALSDERETLTYGELATRVDAWRAALADAGLGHGDRIALALPNGASFVAAFLGSLACGATVFPLSAAAPSAEVGRALTEGGVHAIAAPASRGATLAADVAHVAPEHGRPRIVRRAARTSQPRDPQPDDGAVLAYSFSTSPCTLTMRTHENLWWEAESFRQATRLEAADVIVGAIPLSHAYGLGTGLLAALRTGAPLVLRSRFLRRELLDVLVAERVTVFPAVPFMLRMLTTTDRRRTWDLSALRFCFSAGAPLSRATFDAFKHRFGVAPRQLYGLSAAGTVALDLAPDALVDPASCGAPLGHTAITIQDDAGRPLSPGIIGEVVVRSPAAAGGAAAELETGDLGFVTAEGALSLVGRVSRFVNVAANKVDPHEVAAVLRSHPAVADAAVVAVEGPHAEQSVGAYVVPRTATTAEALRRHCGSALATYKIPRFLAFRDALPSITTSALTTQAFHEEVPAATAARESA